MDNLVLLLPVYVKFKSNKMKFIEKLFEEYFQIIRNINSKKKMNKKEPKLIVLQFNECINTKDIQCLRKLMSSEHLFIDSSKVKVENNLVSEWRIYSHTPQNRKNLRLQ